MWTDRTREFSSEGKKMQILKQENANMLQKTEEGSASRAKHRRERLAAKKVRVVTARYVGGYGDLGCSD